MLNIVNQSKWWRRHFLGVGLVLLAAAVSADYARAQTFGQSRSSGAQAPSAAVQREIDTIALLPQLQAADTTALFQRLGFKPDMPASDWASLSFAEQMEIAYRSAEAVPPPQGSQLLDQVAAITAERYESIQFDPAFQDVFHSPQSSNQSITFGKPSPADLTKPLPDIVRLKLNILSGYVEGTNEFGRVAVLKRHFNLHSPELERALRYRNTRQMLMAATALAAMPPPAEARLNKLAQDIYTHFDSASLDPALRNLVSQTASPRDSLENAVTGSPIASVDESGKVSVHPPRNGVDMEGIGGGGQRISEAAQRNAQFDHVYYPTAESRSFSRVISRVRGRGGIVIGADVRADGIAARPNKVLIDMAGQSCKVARPEAVFGSIVVVMTDRTALRYGPVACDEALAAKRFVYNTYPGMSEWHPGEAIGLMTIDKPTPFIPSNDDLSTSGRRFDAILHPALVDSPIGRAVELSDMLPSARDFLLRTSGNDPNIAAWLKALDTRDVVTWKWHDRTMVVTSVAGRIAVNPDDKTGSTSVLQFRAFREPDEEAEARGEKVGTQLSEFARARKSLTVKVTEYKRLESLMRASAVLRWAKANGASYVGTEPELASARSRTPDNLVIAWDGRWIATAPRLSFQERGEQFCTTLPSVSDAAFAKAPEDLQKELLVQFAIYCRP